jgi:hypothetical protein
LKLSKYIIVSLFVGAKPAVGLLTSSDSEGRGKATKLKNFCMCFCYVMHKLFSLVYMEDISDDLVTAV